MENKSWAKSNFLATFKGARLGYEVGNHRLEYGAFIRDAVGNLNASQGQKIF